MWTGENEGFETGNMNRIVLVPVQIRAPTHTQHVVLIVFERFSLYWWKRYENASVDQNILLKYDV